MRGVLFSSVFESLFCMSPCMAGQNLSFAGQNVSTKQKKLARVFVGEAVVLGPGSEVGGSGRRTEAEESKLGGSWTELTFSITGAAHVTCEMQQGRNRRVQCMRVVKSSRRAFQLR